MAWRFSFGPRMARASAVRGLGLTVLVGAALTLVACGSRGTAPRTPGGAPGTPSSDAAVAQAGGVVPAAEPQGEPFRITWEALAVEREQAENPRFGRRPQQGVVPDQKVILVNESHPDAKRMRQGRTATQQGTETIAVLSDSDMRLLLQGFDQAGFFRHARDTRALQPMFEKPDARGRISVEGADGVRIEDSTVTGRGGGGLGDTEHAVSGSRAPGTRRRS